MHIFNALYLYSAFQNQKMLAVFINSELDRNRDVQPAHCVIIFSFSFSKGGGVLFSEKLSFLAPPFGGPALLLGP